MPATAQCQQQKPAEKTSNWTQIFPAETKTSQQSALYVKKLLAVAVSNITYLRAIFPEAAFGNRCLEDLNLKILRDESSCPGACQVIKWVKGCFDALDKKYLKMMVIGIYTDPENPETVIESYTFKFSYTENEGMEIYRNKKKISSSHSDAETKKATIRLLRTIVVLTQSLQSLPNEVMMTMKLFYYEDVTPEDYEPPGFKASNADNFQFDEEPMNIKVGDVATNFHTMKLRIKTDPKQFEVVEEKSAKGNAECADDEAVKKTPDIDIQASEDVKPCDHNSPISASQKATIDDQEVPNCSQSEPAEADTAMEQEANKPDEQAVDTTGSQNAPGSQDDLGVRCACGYNEDDGLMIMCAECRFWQHGICYQIVDEDEAPATHVCDLCANANNKSPTDPSLSGLSDVALQATCLWRRALYACSKLNRILPQNMSKQLGVEMTVAQGLVNRLEKEGFIKAPAKNKRFGKLVQKDKLAVGLKKYLKKSKAYNDESSQNLTSPSDKNIENEIDDIMRKTQELGVSENDTDNRTGKQKKGHKRVKALQSSEYEFDECDSQDIDSENRGSNKRRKKASIASKSLCI